jgi:hypothetical protein
MKLALALAVGVAATFGGPALGQEPDVCVSEADRDHLRKMTTQALEEAFRQQVIHLFLVWVQDYTMLPEFGLAGFDNARDAYLTAVRIAKAYDPPLCPP